MKQKVVVASAAILVTAAAVCGCGHEQAPPVAATASAPAGPPPLPPPTVAAQQEIALLGMGAHLADDGLFVTINGSEFGGKKQDEFMPEHTELFDPVTKLLKERAELHVIISGYTDNRGRKAANEDLSLQRAASVRDYLVSHDHLDAGRVEVKSEVSADPVASNDTEEGRAQNQRVVLRIIDADGHYTVRAARGVHGSAP